MRHAPGRMDLSNAILCQPEPVFQSLDLILHLYVYGDCPLVADFPGCIVDLLVLMEDLVGVSCKL